ncbi:MAG: response regulator transcription factor [Planctomycetota bacterium]
MRRAIVVEDDARMRRIITKVLTSMGMIVRAASDGVEALNAFNMSRTEPDLICADIKMPNMDGKEFAKRLRHQGVDVPIIFISGTIQKSEEGYRERSHIQLVAKPFSPAQLTELVEEIIARPRPEVGPRQEPPPPTTSAIKPSNLPILPISPPKGFDSGEFPAMRPPSGRLPSSE